MSEFETNTSFTPETKRRKRGRIATAVGILAAASAAFGIGMHESSADKPHPTAASNATPSPTASESEKPGERLAEQAAAYQQEALSFAKISVDELSKQAVETAGQGNETTYQLSNIPTSELTVLEPGKERKRIVATMSFEQGNGSLEIVGVQESREGMKNRVATTFELDQDNPIYDANPDAPITAQDFITAINGVDVNDVRSIIVFGQGIKDQVNGVFAPGKAPVFTNGDNPITEIPAREQIHAVAEAVQP